MGADKAKKTRKATVPVTVTGNLYISVNLDSSWSETGH